MKTLELLRRAKRLIKNKNNWCQGYYARDSDGQIVEANTPEARQWCATGALMKIGNDMQMTCVYGMDFCAQTELVEGTTKSIALFNDKFEHEDVMLMFDQAIALAREEDGAYRTSSRA